MATLFEVRDLGFRFTPRAVSDDGHVFGIRTEGDNPNLRHTLAVYDCGTLIDLWPLPARLYVVAMNSRGWFTGHTWEPHHAFLFADGIFTDLGTLYGHRSSGMAINVHGWIAGWTTAPGGGPETWQQRSRAVLIADGRMRDLAPEEGSDTTARGINDLGEVVGELGLLMVGDTWRPLEGFGPFAINNSGDMAGIGNYRPAIVRNYRLPVLALGAPPWRIGHGRWISAQGMVVGRHWLRDPLPEGGRLYDTFVWRDDSYTSLAGLFPAASGWEKPMAHALGPDDQILGTGLLNGEQHGFLLTPEAIAPTAQRGET